MNYTAPPPRTVAAPTSVGDVAAHALSGGTVAIFNTPEYLIGVDVTAAEWVPDGSGDVAYIPPKVALRTLGGVYYYMADDVIDANLFPIEEDR